MKFEHPTIRVSTPAPGHYIIEGHAPRPVFVDGVGHHVPPHSIHITPELPSDLLRAILRERGEGEPAPAGGKRGRGKVAEESEPAPIEESKEGGAK